MTVIRRLLDARQPGKAGILRASNDRVKAAFNAIDKDRSGALDVNEFHQALGNLGVQLSLNEAAQLFEAMDTNRDGGVTAAEFTRVVHMAIAQQQAALQILKALKSGMRM